MTVPLSPGAYAVHTNQFTMFETGTAASAGLERLAEDGDPAALAAELAADPNVSSSGTFVRGVGATQDGPILPGDAFRFTINASPGDRLSLATMFVQSNDHFYAFDPAGLGLFDRDAPLGGDVTVRLVFYDAGTEADEEPGVGPNQPVRQAGPDTGGVGEGGIERIGNRDGDFTYPEKTLVLRITLTPPE